MPLFTGVIGWLINWSGLIMLFAPTHFRGIRVPGLALLARAFPRRLQEVPGMLIGGLGWQGIVPMRAAKMGSIAVDKAISRLGTPSDFYQQLGPDQIADHIVRAFQPQVPTLIETIMVAEHPRLWRDMPPRARSMLIDRVTRMLPAIIRSVTDQIGLHIDQLLDPKAMVIDQFRRDPSLVVRIFRNFGRRELAMMVRFGFVFGFLFGIPVAYLDHVVGAWWLLPVLGVVVGWCTNLLGMWLIFAPAEPRKVGPFTVQGLFPRRQAEAAVVYAELIAGEVITLERIGQHLLEGPRGDRTQWLVRTAMRPAIELALGPTHAAVRIAIGAEKFDRIKESMATEAVVRTIGPFQDPEFSQVQAVRIRALIAERCAQLPPAQFVEMMRAAIQEDEWLLYAHGAIMGFAGGLLHLWLFGVGGS
ncbi:hypothetical protein EFK50_03630 [Nocardioides marmoriginsengisoli]|uniref:DUF445 family protein n=1 Tax=Nocardioides marmoriginsengisoli TaxID=661483 RepID=A0A3N0CPW5_9ACTN|nr:hypothetical protein EFK50_03630 [Nocardioides marmoriginsengisoli]